ncbi:MAG: hypothetical protein ACKVQU_34170 [Burkholderiales bacterium]
MITLHDATGLAGLTFVLATAIAAVVCPPAARRSRFIAVGTGLLIASMAPVAGLPLIAQVRALAGDPSLPTIVLAASVWVVRVGSAQSDNRHDAIPSSLTLLALIAVIGALFLYPFALGATLFDPYRLGYDSVALVGVVLAIALAAAYAGRTLVAVSLALGVIAWSAGWYASTNLFDYLLDPMLAGWAVLTVISRRRVRLLPRSRFLNRS